MCVRRCLNNSVCFPLFEQFLETEMIWSHLIIVESELMFRVTLKGKSGINQI